ncbi:ATP-binding protein [Sphaerisporangium aureirubrum]|uniref:ATP-binding protein n=1 Tax=Sphaerisporangium aureirubrum TaxID=1544736 RepID=A0ABW1NUV1_9ACTN
MNLLGCVDLSGRPGSVALAREYTCELLRVAGGPYGDDVALLVGEVTANAVKHSDSGRLPGGTVRLRVYGDGRAVRVEVIDEGSATTAPRIPERTDPLVEGGRGLWLVQELSSAWGWRQDGAHRVVWFEIG